MSSMLWAVDDATTALWHARQLAEVNSDPHLEDITRAHLSLLALGNQLRKVRV